MMFTREKTPLSLLHTKHARSHALSQNTLLVACHTQRSNSTRERRKRKTLARDQVTPLRSAPLQPPSPNSAAGHQAPLSAACAPRSCCPVLTTTRIFAYSPAVAAPMAPSLKLACVPCGMIQKRPLYCGTKHTEQLRRRLP